MKAPLLRERGNKNDHQKNRTIFSRPRF
jgi:hypothetical protein